MAEIDEVVRDLIEMIDESNSGEPQKRFVIDQIIVSKRARGWKVVAKDAQGVYFSYAGYIDGSRVEWDGV